MAELLAILAGGLLGSAHCVGMCGGLVAVVGATPQPWVRAVGRQLVYALGRLFTYVFLGAMGGAAGQYLARFEGALVGTQQVFSVLAGAAMIIIGASALGVFTPERWLPRAWIAWVVPALGHFLRAQGRGHVLLAGVANGFLPCGLVYAFLALAVARGNAVEGMLLMACFGVGTVPAMVLVGCGSTFLSHRARWHVYRVAACFLIVAGCVTIARGWAQPDSCCAEAQHHHASGGQPALTTERP